MTKMRFLKFYAGKWSDRCHIYLPNGLQSLSDNLRYLQWHGYCLVSLPSTFSAKWLVELSMPYSNLEKLWDGVQDLVHLKEVDLRFSKNLVAVPDLSMATNLEGLSLLHCKSLRQVHPSILSLHKLKYLDLEGCTEIESLQTDIDLESLCDLRLSHCSNLKEFSISSKNLVRLWLGGTAIQEFPSSIWRCKRLQLINLEGCVNLDSVGNQLSPDLGMGSLGVLVLSGCKQLNASNLCCILDRLLFLKWLSMEDCCNLQALPDSIGFLKSLESLKLSGSNVESLSANVKNLLKLRELWLDNCKKLVQLPELPPSLQILSAVNCTSLETDFTQQLVLEKNISFSLKHGLKERPRFAFLPGAQISGRFSFLAEGTSITVSHLPQSGLHGYILCLILSQSPPNGKYAYVKCVIDKDSERTGSKYTFPINQSLISDHVFLRYIDINKGEDNPFYREMQKSGVYDYCNISFKFNLHGDNGEWLTNRIKGCGVYPVYAFEHGYSSRHKGSVLELGGGSKDIAELQPRAIGFEVKGSKSNHDNDDNQTKKLQQVMNQDNITTGMQHKKEDFKGKSPYHHFTEHGCEGQPESFKDEDYLMSSVPKNDIIPSDTPSVSYIDSNQTIEVFEEKYLIDNQVNCFEPFMFEKAHTFVEIDNQPLEPDWDPIAELESMLCDSYKLSAISTQSTTISNTEQGPNVGTILQKLEMLLETSLEIISSDNEVKQKFHDVLKQLDQFEDQVPVKLHHVICKLKTFIEGVDVGFVAAQKTIQDYDQLLQSRSLLSKQLKSAKARQDQINSNVSQGKIQFEKINSKIVELEQKLSDLVETRDKLKRALDDYDVEKSKLVFEVAQWVPECKTVTTALKKSETSYKMALTNKKKTEDEWANLKKSFEDNKI
ncbi:Leucine-rich repeat 3 [Sesbania bispinosa]|nr:Leucine-rich repeat 3 [Sesbania bispinosa]